MNNKKKPATKKKIDNIFANLKDLQKKIVFCLFFATVSDTFH